MVTRTLSGYMFLTTEKHILTVIKQMTQSELKKNNLSRRHLNKEVPKMTYYHKKRCLTEFSIGKLQVKTVMRYISSSTGVTK